MDDNIDSLIQEVEQAFLQALGSSVETLLPSVKQDIASFISTVTSNVKAISDLVVSHAISSARADTLLELQKNSLKEQALALAGLSEVALQNAINSAWQVLLTLLNLVKIT